MVVLKDCPVRPPVEREGMRDEPVGAELAGAVPGKIEVLGAVAAVPGVPGVPVVGAEPGGGSSTRRSDSGTRSRNGGARRCKGR